MALLREYRAALAFILVAIAAAVAITISADHTARIASREAAIVLHKSQLQSCARSNTLRNEINVHIGDTAQTRAVLVDFLNAAEIARRDAYNISHSSSDLYAANAYKRELTEEKAIHYPRIETVNCAEAFPAP